MSDVQECWSIDNECFNAVCLGELVDSNSDDIVVGTVVYKGDAVSADISSLLSAEDIVEMLSERAYDEYGEAAEDYPDVSKEEMAELDKLLQGWIEKCCKPTFYSVRNVKEYVITEEDLL